MGRLTHCVVEAKTEKAIKVAHPVNGTEWIPLSQVVETRPAKFEEGETIEMKVTDWILEQKEWEADEED